MKKGQSFNIHRLMKILRQHYKTWDAPSVTLMSNSGATPFQVLVSTLLSLRTKDEVTLDASRRLFKQARTPEQMCLLETQQIEQLIYPVGFYLTKASRLKAISKILLEQYNGAVPATLDALLKLPGVGRKTANLVLAEGFKKPAICVDTHVHRISNRFGYVHTQKPDDTEFALRKMLPKKYWGRYNQILVAFGQTICRPISPFCSRCPVRELCARCGVDRHR